MIIVISIVVGLCFGSFINALVWRLKKQDELAERKSELAKRQKSSNSKLQTPNYSVIKGRSMCPNCQHMLVAGDLIPVFSWLFLKAKCRYCRKPISWQYPSVELLTALLFVASWLFWPTELVTSWQYAGFVGWLALLVGLIALAVYDIKWMILPDKIVYPLVIIAAASIAFQLLLGRPIADLTGVVLSAVIGGGIFWLIYQISGGKWIGGGDVKLGFLLGIIVARPEYAFMVLFLSSVLAMVFIFPFLATKKLKKDSKIPYGPFLIAAAFIVVLFGAHLMDVYKAALGL